MHAQPITTRPIRRLLALGLGAALVLGPAAPAVARTPDTPGERVDALREARASALRLYDLLPVTGADPEESDPVVDEAADEAAAEADHGSADGTAVVHVVGVGQTLADVAALHGVTGEDGWRRLFDANPDIDDPDVVEVLTRVRIPAADEVVAARALPAPPPRPAARASRGDGGGGGGGGGVWDRLAACEAGGNWAANTGNGYFGGLQFSPSSWAAVGGTGLPHQHSRATQIAMGQRLQTAQGWGAWPSCARSLGLR